MKKKSTVFKNKYPLIVKSLEDFPRQCLSEEQAIRQSSILYKYKDGWTLEKIGKHYKITRERIRQIVEHGLIDEAKQIVKEGIYLNLKEFLLESKRKHSNAVGKRKPKLHKKTGPVGKKTKRWSRKYDSCINCGTTVIKYHSNGYCNKCYPKTELFKDQQRSSHLRNYEARRKRTKEYSKQYYKRPEIITKLSLKSHGGNREKAILRDGEKCKMCSLTRRESYTQYGKDLFVIHIGNKNDNKLENLMTLCRKCFASSIKKGIRDTE